jgi:hypothetical protein
MYSLGFPADAIEVVKGLYTGATTKFRVAGTHSRPVPVERGTIQGDTLSPFLFLVYIEPLLRWLQVGGRGYAHSCLAGLTQEDQMKRRVASLAYADDLACTTGSATNLKVQADKVSRYADWGHLIVSGSKTVVTGMAWRKARASGHQDSPASTAQRLLDGQIQIQPKLNPKPLPFLPPDRPFRYLGVWIALNLDWSHQKGVMTQELRRQLDCLRRSCASPRATLRIIQSVVTAKIAYPFCAVPCSPADIHKWDAMIGSLMKKKHGLMQCAPTAMLREDKSRCGLGVTSLAVEYHHRNQKALFEALNDYCRARGPLNGDADAGPHLAGRYGAITDCMLQVQLQNMGSKGKSLGRPEQGP